MSSTLKIDGSFITDPLTAAWQAIRSELAGGVGQKPRSMLRDVVLEFTTLSAAAYAAILADCDTYETHTIFAPRRLDATYETDPETGTGNFADESLGFVDDYDISYSIHFLGASFGPGDVAYDVRILAYSYVAVNNRGAG